MSETTRPSAFIFNILHHQKVLYQNCSNYAPGVLYYWIHCDLWPFPQVSDPGPSGPSCYKFHKTCFKPLNYKMHHKNSIYNFIFQINIFYFTNKLLYIAIQITKHILKLNITLFMTNYFSANRFILRDVFKLTKILHNRISPNCTNILSNV